MNDLIRPALYHVRITRSFRCASPRVPRLWRTWWGRFARRAISWRAAARCANATPGDFLAISTAGAYGFVQSSNYNSRTRAPEILVEGNRFRTIRARETYADLVRGEVL